MQPPAPGPARASPRRNREGMICRQCPDLPLRVQCPHSDEGRLYLAQITSTTKNKTARAPQRCSKCPNRPLRSQCQHTQVGRTFLLQQEIRVDVPGLMEIPLAPIVTQTPPPHMVFEPSATGTPPRPTPVSSRVLTTPHPSQSPGPQPITYFNGNSVIDPALCQDYAPNSSPGPAPLTLNNPTIQRALLATESQPGPTTSPAPPMQFIVPVTPRSTDNSSTIMTPSSQGQTSPSTSSTPSKPSKKQERTSKSNPYHGFVKGSMRGTHDHVIFRRHKRPEALLDSKEASKTFLDKINRLVERAEDLSVKTGCWLFVGAQHPGASGATIHYTSPRLVRDAPDHVGDIVNDYHQLMSNLLQARRIEALNLSQKYQATLAQNHEMAARVADLEGQMLTMQQSIDLYKTRLFAEEQAAASAGPADESPTT